MAAHSARTPRIGKTPFFPNLKNEKNARKSSSNAWHWTFLAAVVFLASIAVAQNAPQVTGVDPAMGKVNDTITVSGSNMGKASVSAVYLSDDKNDFKATIVDQSDDKITLKIPQVKAGDYNISIQVGDKLFIKPVKFKVEE
ncbi:MAG TPA: IPT/TIG domain-containing protein [Candidatus Acidoferrales bacterium]